MTKYHLLASLLIVLLLTISPVYASPGTEHAADMLEVLLGERQKYPDIRINLREFTKTIDNFKVLEGIPVGKAGHRVYGHWGFAADIPFEGGELKAVLDRIAATEGEGARRAAVEKIRAAWHNDAKQLINISERLLGLDGRAARGLAGMLYDIHLLGDWQGKKLGSLQDANAIFVDLEKNVHRLFGNNSKAARELVPYLRNSIEAAQISCKGMPACSTLYIMDSLKKSQAFRGYLSNFLQYRTATAGLLYSPLTARLPSGPKSFTAYETILRQQGARVASVQPGILLPNGRLLVSVKTGSLAGILVFAMDSGTAGYNYIKGDILKPELQRELTTAALNATAFSGGVAVAVALGANPAGIIVIGVGAGAYFVMDTTQKIWHQEQDRKYITRDDLKMLGIAVDSPLEIKIDNKIPLNAENWD